MGGDRRPVKPNPFDSQLAVDNSGLHWATASGLTAAPTNTRSDPFLFEAHTAFRNLVLAPGFSCVGAKAALNENAYGLATYPRLASAETTAGLCHDLCEFAHSHLVERTEYATFIAVFREPAGIDEAGFEQLLWQQLQGLHQADRVHFGWDHSVSPDPDDPEFSFSFAGRAFYVIGMHPGSSRTARTFKWPAMVFNAHEQFERLRTEGKWKRMQRSIRAREMVLQGSINPMLSDFGQQSEARQYSGRAVPNDWKPPGGSGGKCPFGH